VRAPYVQTPSVRASQLGLISILLSALFAWSACGAGLGSSDTPSIALTSDSSPTSPSSPPDGTPTATESASTSLKTPKPREGSSAGFEYFKVTVSQIKYSASTEALVLADVCVRSLPPDPQGNRTRISWDPWSVTSGSRAAEAGYRGAPPKGMFPSDRTYRVGQCASGWIPFVITGELDTVRYANGVGDKAVWDAEHLDQKPTTSHGEPRSRSSAVIGEGTFIVGDDIQPGRYKARAGKDGLCYWARLKDDSGDFDSIIANNSTSGQASVTIKSSDGAFETSGCTPWRRQ
jgi:hypothetical protein